MSGLGAGGSRCSDPTVVPLTRILVRVCHYVKVFIKVCVGVWRACASVCVCVSSWTFCGTYLCQRMVAFLCMRA